MGETRSRRDRAGGAEQEGEARKRRSRRSSAGGRDKEHGSRAGGRDFLL